MLKVDSGAGVYFVEARSPFHLEQRNQHPTETKDLPARFCVADAKAPTWATPQFHVELKPMLLEDPSESKVVPRDTGKSLTSK